VAVSVNGNIGSRHQPFVNCITTQRTDHPDYSLGLSECYWNNSALFHGWFQPGPGQGSAAAYGQILADHFSF
jgi:hypothetical protein